MASVVAVLARYRAMFVVLVVFLASVGLSSEVIWSQDPLNGCCGKCNTSNECKASPAFQKTSTRCSYIQYDKTLINPSTSISKSCGKPDKLSLNLSYGFDSTVLNVTWKFPKDATIAKVKGFLMVVKYENPSVSGEIVNWFQINGNLDTEEGFLTEEDLMKLADVEFAYDCVKVLANTKYTVTVKTLPSIRDGALERATLLTNETDEKAPANCNSRWVALMFVQSGHPSTVCFKSAPEHLQINNYVLHVMPYDQYYGQEPRTSENMVHINLTGQGMSGKYICRNFTLIEQKAYVAMLQPNEWCTCFNAEETCHHTYIDFMVPPELTIISLSAANPSTTSSLGGGGPPTWHVALIAFFISLIVVTGVILVAIYCFIDGFQDFLRGLLSHMVPTTDVKVLLVFQPTTDNSTNEAINKFVCHLKWKSRASVETVPHLDMHMSRCTGAAECIKCKPEEPSAACQCFCCTIDKRMDVESEVKREILLYNRIILFHSEESSKNYLVFQETDTIPVGKCSAFIRLASLYDRKSKPANEERKRLNQQIHGKTSPNPESKEVVRRNPIGPVEPRPVSQTSLGLPSREESGYYSCHIEETELTEELKKMESEEKKTEDDFQADTSQPPKFLNDQSFEQSSVGSTLDRSLNDFYGLPPVAHVRVGSDEGVDMDLVTSSFNHPEVFDSVKDFSKIVNFITNTSYPYFVSPSVVSEI